MQGIAFFWVVALRGRSIVRSICSLRVVIALVLLWPDAAGVAVAKNWNVVNGNWSVPGNWSPSGLPASGEATNIVFTNGVARTVTYDVAAPSLGLLTIDLTGAGATTNTLSIPNSLTLQAGAAFRRRL